MSKQSDGGPAFPYSRIINGPEGMSLRDYFAGQAITLFPLSEKDIRQLRREEYPDRALVAQFCVKLADAMLSELSKGEVKG